MPAPEVESGGRRPFSGAVLVGGASHRMGTDKAFLTLAVEVRRFPHRPPAGTGNDVGDDRPRPFASIVRSALVEAGAAEVLAVGATGERAERLEMLGLRPVPDRTPGEGPLGGLLTALSVASHDRLVVLACDLPRVTAEAVRTLITVLDEGDQARPGVIAVAGGRDQPLLGAWRRAAVAPLRTAFEGGERSLTRALATVDPVRVALPAAWAHNVNTPGELDVPPAGGA